MMNLKFKFSLFSFILLFFIGCKTSTSDFSSYTNNSKDYFLTFRGHDNNGALKYDSSRFYIKSFFSTPSWPFFMDYNVIPPVNQDPNQGYEEIVGNEKKEGMIQKIAAQLSSDSTFIFFIDAHGDTDGTCTTGTKDLKAEDVIKALKGGLNKNPNTKIFKRFIIMSTSCYSGELIGQFKANKDSRNGSLFKEGIYIYTSDASEKTFAVTTSELFIPMFVFLRQLQVERCMNTEDDYDTIYESTKNDIKKSLKQNLSSFRDDQDKTNILNNLESCLSLNNRKYSSLSTTPTFSDIVNIIDRINGIKTNHTSMKVEFSDSSIRNKTVFPDIEGCE